MFLPETFYCSAGTPLICVVPRRETDRQGAAERMITAIDVCTHFAAFVFAGSPAVMDDQRH